jgi:hypothetical protein
MTAVRSSRHIVLPMPCLPTLRVRSPGSRGTSPRLSLMVVSPNALESMRGVR